MTCLREGRSVRATRGRRVALPKAPARERGGRFACMLSEVAPTARRPASIPMLFLGRNPANSDLQEVHGDDPELGEEDPDAGVMGKRVPFGPFLALAALEWVLLRRQLDALFAWMLGG